MSAPRPVRRGSVPPWLVAACVAVVDVVVRLPRLGTKDLWLDEAVAVHIAELDPFGIIAATRGDTTPPVYYLVLSAFERVLGISEWAVRFPSVLASGLLGGALFLLAYRWIGRVGAWTASALFLVSDVHLAFAHEARPYTLVALLCAVSFALFLEARQRGAWRWWVGLAGVNAVLVFTHYLAVLAIVSQGLTLLGPTRRHDLRRFGLVHLPVAAALAAWVAPLLRAGEHNKMGWLEIPTAMHAAKLLGWYTGGHRGFPGFLVLLLGTIAALVASRRRGDHEELHEVAAVCATWGFAPILLAFAASHLGFRSFHPRYVLYASTGLTLLWSAGVQALPGGRWRAAGAALALLATAPGFARSLADRGPEWRRAAEIVHAQAPDRILLFPYFEMTTFAYHYDRPAFVDARRTNERLAREGVREIVDASTIPALDLDVPTLVVVQGPSFAPFAPVERALAGRGFVEVERQAARQVVVRRLARRVEPPR